MKCPECKEEMILYYQDISYRDDGKEYSRNYFNCEKDDIWMMVEIPKKKQLA